MSSETTHQLDTKLRSNSSPFLLQVRNNKRLETKAEQSVPVLKENSIMQRLLMESQGQGEPATRSKAAAIKQEITHVLVIRQRLLPSKLLLLKQKRNHLCNNNG